MTTYFLRKLRMTAKSLNTNIVRLGNENTEHLLTLLLRALVVIRISFFLHYFMKLLSLSAKTPRAGKIQNDTISRLWKKPRLTPLVGKSGNSHKLVIPGKNKRWNGVPLVGSGKIWDSSVQDLLRAPKPAVLKDRTCDTILRISCLSVCVIQTTCSLKSVNLELVRFNNIFWKSKLLNRMRSGRRGKTKPQLQHSA